MPPPLLPRRPIAIANWKMFLSASESLRVARSVCASLKRHPSAVEIVLCPSASLLGPLRALLAGSRLVLGAQDAHAELRGAHTGDISVLALKDFVRYVIVGHAERRTAYGETDALVAAKTQRVLEAHLRPIVCFGETAEERAAGKTLLVVRQQVNAVVTSLPALAVTRLVFAYEPRWAISGGPGKPAPQPEARDAGEILRFVRRIVREEVSSRAAERVRVVYGGSVDARTAGPFLREESTDGVLVGGASTEAAVFLAIVRELGACHS